MGLKSFFFGSPDAGTSTGATFALGLLRIAVGWHFLYEGVAKLLTPNWSAESYLMASTGPFAEHFRQLAADPKVLGVINQLNIWGLTLIGAALILGLFTRPAALCGMGMLAMYYASNPPWFQGPGIGPVEGHYLLVNKNLVELIVLLVVLVYPASRFGLEGFFWLGRRKSASNAGPAGEAEEALPGMPPAEVSRRGILTSLTGIPFAGGFAVAALRRHRWLTPEEKVLADAYSGATSKGSAAKRLEELKGQLPQGQIGNLKLSRMILGGNLMGGWAHARDLLYASSLVKAYHHRAKIFETFALAEACGVNAILTNPVLCAIINDYWRTTGGKIHFISDCGGKDVLEAVQKSIDAGAAACYIQGGIADKLVEKGDFDTIAKAMELIRRNGLPAGIGGHQLETIKGCRDKGLKPDFWMKTMHHGKYWSSFGGDEEVKLAHDHFWCRKPDEVIAYMKEVKEPWIAFKILAAGAIHPKNGFRYALEAGADFICVGMYDFQLVEDVNIALGLLDPATKLKRQREWCA